MSLRDALLDLIGAEIQQHDVTVFGKTKRLCFRQVTDAEGRAIYAPVDGESAQDRGIRVMRALVAASACDEAGVPLGTVAEVAALPSAAFDALFAAAALTNNLVIESGGAAAAVPEGDGPKG